MLHLFCLVLQIAAAVGYDNGLRCRPRTRNRTGWTGRLKRLRPGP